MASWIAPDDVWSIWAVAAGLAAFSIWLEQTYRWAARVSGVIIALVLAMMLANAGIIPTESPVYDVVWEYVVLLAIPIMLFKADLRRIWKESGRTFLAFNISAVGTILGVALGLLIFSGGIPEPINTAAMMTGTYIGGTVNFVAMAAHFGASQDVVNAAIVADNFNMMLCFFVLLYIPGIAFFRRHYAHPCEDAANAGLSDGRSRAAAWWGRKEISLLDIASVMAAGLILTALSVRIAAWLGGMEELPPLLQNILGNRCLVVTTLTVLCVTLFPRFFQEAHGAQEIATFLIYIFFVVIGAPASVRAVLSKSPMLFLFCTFIVMTNVIFTLAVGKLLRFNLEELLIASNAATGGPTTAAAMAISKGWDALVLPSMLVGVWGYAVGSWCAVLLAELAASLSG